MGKQRAQKIELLRQILNGTAKFADLVDRRMFEIWVNKDQDFSSHTSMFENSKGEVLSRADIEINEALGVDAVYNIFI